MSYLQKQENTYNWNDQICRIQQFCPLKKSLNKRLKREKSTKEVNGGRETKDTW